MADKKISALTAATTPLAGTEVLPIVQSGATVKVSVNNLTAGKAVSALTLTASGQIKSIGLSADYFSPQMRITSNDSLATGEDLLVGYNTTADKGYIQSVHWGTGYTQLLLNPSGGDVGIGNGNLVIGTSGKGIDFSADPSAAGMTSELLDDYEEGTWTVVWTSLTGTPASTTGYYTKIGRMVYFTYSTGSGSITGSAGSTRFSLPFAPAIEASGTQISQNVNFDSTTLILPSNSSVYVGTFTSNFMVFSGAYNV